MYSINSFSAATFIHSYHHNLLPCSFPNLFLRSNQVHHYDTQLTSQYRRHFCGTNIKQLWSVSFIEDQQSGMLCQLH